MRLSTSSKRCPTPRYKRPNHWLPYPKRFILLPPTLPETTPFTQPSVQSFSSLKLAELTRTSSRSNMFSCGSNGQVWISSRTIPITKPNDLSYYIRLDKVSEDLFDRFGNPDGVIQLGLSENRASIAF
ncbi:hypothetical protein V6N13_027765 [Hibiscus sabdariffa]|uniref:Uncharacterized protein n=1 Tax=Hibiscus sabdariffa TaxID=183260 RepID=A0ABR2CHK5_9ROSI